MALFEKHEDGTYDLSRVPTQALLKWKRSRYSMAISDDELDRLAKVDERYKIPIKELKTELKTREHVLSKPEAKESRRLAAQGKIRVGNYNTKRRNDPAGLASTKNKSEKGK